MRAFAILMVLVHHVAAEVHGTPEWVESLIQQGAHGVDLFFALSGFLIGNLFFREWDRDGSVDIGHFYARRLTRTLPPYYIMLAVSYLAVWLVRGEPFDWGYLIFAQNYYTEIPFFPVSWSLAVEEHFYLVLPVALTVLMRFTDRDAHRMALMLAVGLLPLGFRLADPMVDAPFGYAYTATHRNFDFMTFGVVGAYMYHRMPDRIHQPHWGLYTASGITMALLGTMPWWPKALEMSIGDFGLAIGFALMVILSVQAPNIPGAKHRLTKMIAYTSYATYLTHPAVIYALAMVQHRIEMPQIVFFTITMAASLAVGWVFYRIIEQPLMRWRDRVTSRQTSPQNS